MAVGFVCPKAGKEQDGHTGAFPEYFLNFYPKTGDQPEKLSISFISKQVHIIQMGPVLIGTRTGLRGTSRR